MTTEKIQRLIDRFLDGDTTPREEQLLYDFFQQEDVPEELREYREVFVKLGDALRVVPAPDHMSTSISAPEKTKALLRWWAVAAGVAIVLGVVGWMRMGRPATESQGTEGAYVTQAVARNVKEASPKGEDNTTVNGNPGINPRATNRTSLRDCASDDTSTDEETSVRPGVRLDESSAQYAMLTEETPSDEIFQREYACLEEEFLKSEAQRQTVSL